jgi:hypothetical protein
MIGKVDRRLSRETQFRARGPAAKLMNALTWNCRQVRTVRGISSAADTTEILAHDTLLKNVLARCVPRLKQPLICLA